MTSDGEDAWLAHAFESFDPAPGTLLGLGHDTAALAVGGDGVVVVAKDIVIDGVHFDLTACGPAAAAYKALAVNLSDLAAAAAEPIGFLVGVVLPRAASRAASRALFEDLMEGFAEASRSLGCPCLGGDTNAAEGPLVLSVTVLGRPGALGVVSRAGAQVGDCLSVTGALGGSGRGRHLRFRPRLREAAALAAAGVPHAMLDLSDGLSSDLPRLCRASGVGAVVVSERVPIHADVNSADVAAGDVDAADGRSPIEHALHDGEDFELLLAHGALDAPTRDALAAAGVALHTIGRCVALGEGVSLEQDGTRQPLEARGFDHLRDHPLRDDHLRDNPGRSG